VIGNLARLLSNPGSQPDAVALLYDGRSITYSELNGRVADVAAVLAGRGVQPGDRVALVLPNAPSFVAAYLGVLWLGAIVVPLNILLRPGEIEERLQVAQPSIVVADDERAAALASTIAARGLDSVLLEPDAPAAADDAGVGDPVARSSSDPAAILFTSGTSGVPKGAVLTHGGIETAARNAAAALSFGPGDVVYGAAPFSHVLGQSTGLVATFACGGAVAVVSRFEPSEAVVAMVETGTTVFLGVPTMFIALCQAAGGAGDLPRLRIAHVGGAPMPDEVTREFERTFGADVYEGYGLTELSGIATSYLPGQSRRAGSVGLPLGDTELRIVSLEGDVLSAGEVGEVQFRGPTLISGYWQSATSSASAFTPGDWLATGDLGYVDDDGYLFLVDRLKEMIIRGGYNVYPREVEEALYRHPAVREAAVIGMPHPTLGEEVVALVVPNDGAAADPEEIRSWAREQVAAYKYPRHVVLVAELPKGPTGKILKRAIDREELGRLLPANPA
jgi:long-chain acyl-CoA synthetase